LKLLDFIRHSTICCCKSSLFLRAGRCWRQK
jgi:hypothetical protein